MIKYIIYNIYFINKKLVKIKTNFFLYYIINFILDIVIDQKFIKTKTQLFAILFNDTLLNYNILNYNYSKIIS